MSSEWERSYHYRELKKATGQEWMPSPGTVDRAVRSVDIARRNHAAAQSVARMLTITSWLSFVSIGAGIVFGLMALFSTVGPVVAFVLGGIGCLAASVGARSAVQLGWMPRVDAKLLDAEESYGIALDKAVRS